MSWRVSHAVDSLRSEVNTEHPDRSKISDGTIGDDAHSARTSDHNPDENGIVHAWDITKDDALNVAQQVVDFLVASRDKRIKYLIWEGRIMSGQYGPSPWVWRNYTGANGHYHHAHLSVHGDDGAPWGYPATQPEPEPEPEGWLMALTDDEQKELLTKVRAIHAETVVSTDNKNGKKASGRWLLGKIAKGEKVV